MTHSTFISHDGTKIAYNLWNGTKKRRWIIFIHGLGGNLTAWDPIISRFGNNGVNLAALDLRGHGHSGRPRTKKAYEFRKNSLDVLEFMKHMHIKKAVLVGHSSGALVALDVAIKNPDAVESLILLAPNHDDVLLHYGFLMNLFKYILIGMVRVIARIARYVPLKKLKYPNYGKLKSKSGLHTFYQDMLGNSLDIYFWNLLAYLTAGRRKDVSKIMTRTLLIHGTKDKAVSVKFSREMKELMPNSELIEIEDGGHQLVFESRDHIYKVLKRFIEGKL